MTGLQRYQCDFCGNAYNKEPAAVHTIDGDEHEVCEECEREFQRVTDYPEKAAGMGYQYHGLYVPKTEAGESVWRHFSIVNDEYHSLAEWALIDKMLLAYHRDYLSSAVDEFDEGDGYKEVSQRAENSVRSDDTFNLER